MNAKHKPMKIKKVVEARETCLKWSTDESMRVRGIQRTTPAHVCACVSVRACVSASVCVCVPTRNLSKAVWLFFSFGSCVCVSICVYVCDGAPFSGWANCHCKKEIHRGDTSRATNHSTRANDCLLHVTVLHTHRFTTPHSIAFETRLDCYHLKNMRLHACQPYSAAICLCIRAHKYQYPYGNDKRTCDSPPTDCTSTTTGGSALRADIKYNWNILRCPVNT